jgi:hypothetical protein
LRGTIISYTQFNSKIAGEHLLLTTHNGEQLALRGVRVRQDSTLLVQESDGLQRLLPTQDILSIESTNRAIGAIDGFFVGVYSCGVIGYAYGSKTYTRDYVEGIGVANSTLRSAAIGGLIGTLLGIGYGHSTTYEISTPQTASKPDSLSTLGSAVARKAPVY